LKHTSNLNENLSDKKIAYKVSISVPKFKVKRAGLVSIQIPKDVNLNHQDSHT